MTHHHQVATKLGKPASRVRLYCSDIASSLVSSGDRASSIVSSSSSSRASSILSFGGGSICSGNLSNMALVEGGSLAVRWFQLFDLKK